MSNSSRPTNFPSAPPSTAPSAHESPLHSTRPPAPPSPVCAPTNASYRVKARPNLFDLAIMDGFLNGGGQCPSVQREAYWAEPPSEAPDSLFLQEQENKDH